MTLGRLIKLYHAEMQGKQIMKNTVSYLFSMPSEHVEEVKLSEYELSDLVSGRDNESQIFFIKDEENRYGNPI